MAYGFNDDKSKVEVYDKTEVYNKQEVYSKDEVYNKNDFDSMDWGQAHRAKLTLDSTETSILLAVQYPVTINAGQSQWIGIPLFSHSKVISYNFVNTNALLVKKSKIISAFNMNYLCTEVINKSSSPVTLTETGTNCYANVI